MGRAHASLIAGAVGGTAQGGTEIMRHHFASALVAVAAVVGVTTPVAAHAAGPAPFAPPLAARPIEIHPSGPTVSTAGATLPLFTTTHNGPGKVWKFQMVGSNPVTGGGSVTVPVKIIPVRAVFPGGGLDASQRDPACLPNGSAVSYVPKSPMFATRGYTLGGTNMGNSQFIDVFRRAEFRLFTQPGGKSPNNHLKLSAQILPAVTFSGNSSNSGFVKSKCGIFGEISFAAFDSFVTSTIPKLKSEGVTPGTLPLFVLYNTGLVDGGCCATGYHFKMKNPVFGGAFQTYGVADFDTSGQFPGAVDSEPLSHELAEWADDPTGVNPVPAWGGVGQVRNKCQNNLEPGDPLSGSLATVPTSGLPFHVQDLAFVSWFYRDSPSIGVNGWYSLLGTFRHASRPCPPGG